MKKWLNKMAGVLIITTLLPGCFMFGVIPLNPDPGYVISQKPQSVITQRLPLRLGVYFPLETREYRYPIYGGDQHFELGPPTVTVFNVVLASMFEEANEVQQLSPAVSDLDAIIEISIENFYYNLWTYPQQCRITYRFIVYGTDGTPLASWVEYGNGNLSDYIPSWSRSAYQHNTESAILDGAKKFISNFRSQPRIRQWLETTASLLRRIYGENRLRMI